MTDSVPAQRTHEPAHPFLPPLSYRHTMPKQAFDVWADRYALHDEKTGERVEQHWSETVERVARTIAGPMRQSAYERFTAIMRDMRFIPGGRVLAGAGLLDGKTATLLNCFIVPVEDSLDSIFRHCFPDALDTLSMGGGVGINWSALRERGALLFRKRGEASGPGSYMPALNEAASTISQGGSRRGAQMYMLNARHPDVEEFATFKALNPGSLSCANVSVVIGDDFVDAYRKNETWHFKSPTGRDLRPERYEKGQDKTNARDLMRLFAHQAWSSGDPGLWFEGRANYWSNATDPAHRLVCTNPCGEVGLRPYGNCNLGSINLMAHLRWIGTNGDSVASVDWAALEATITTAIEFLDTVLDVSSWPVPQMGVVGAEDRRIGLGFMGWADFASALKIPYGSEEHLRLTEEVYRFQALVSYRASAELAKQRGTYGTYRPEVIDRPYVRQVIEADPAIGSLIARYGLRNVALQAQAPTGSISMLAGVNYGIEPFFARGALINDRVNKNVIQIGEHAWNPDVRTAVELSALEHLMVQVAAQKWIDQSTSKTCNAPQHDTPESVETLYDAAVAFGIKGITYYRDGSKEGAPYVPLTQEQLIEHSLAQRQEVPADILAQYYDRECKSGVCTL